METKQSARELLKECREVLLRGQADEQMAMVAGIDAYLAAPSESAMETVEKIRDTEYARYADTGEKFIKHVLSDTEAAALIEGLQRRVPRAMLREIYHQTASGANPFSAKSVDNYLNVIAAKHGVVIE